MSKSKKPSYKGEFGRITMAENDESEFKVGFFFKGELNGSLGPQDSKDELRLSLVGEEVYKAYLKHRYCYEEDNNSAVPRLVLANGATRASYHQETSKERRVRSFFMLANDQPYDLEIRVEDRDGKKILMLKKGNGATPDKPVIRRKEIKLTANDVRENPHTMLVALPKKLQRQLGFEFNSKSGLYEPMQTNSMRLKTKVRDTDKIIIQKETEIGLLDFVIEPAYDTGSGLTLTQERWPIRETEFEVKGIYRQGDAIDLKKFPELAGLSEEDIEEMSADVLKPEREDFIEFSILYLLEKTRENPGRYGDIDVDGIYDSKSAPGRRLMASYLNGEKCLQELTRQAQARSEGAFVWH